MTRTEIRFGPIGWGTSLFLHGAVLFLGGYFIIKQPQYGIEAAKTSTEVELVADSTPPPPAPPAPETPPPLPPIPDEMAEPMPVQPTPVFSQVVEKIALPQPYQLPAPAQIPQPKPQPVTRPVKNQGLAHSQTATEASPALRGAEEAKPDYLRNPPPVYPEDSREAREQGIVILLVTVSASGKPTQISLQQSSHYPRLDRAALDAVRDWKFRPASLGGVTIESQVAVPVRFELQ